MQWLNTWQTAVKERDITAEEFLTVETARGLRISLQSTMDICRYLIDKFGFKYLLTGKLNQDNLEVIFVFVLFNDIPDKSHYLFVLKILWHHTSMRGM